MARKPLRGAGFWIAAPLVVAAGAAATWYGSQPVVRVEWEPRRDTTRFEPVPPESVRVLASQIEPGCLPVRIVARLHVRGRLIGPSDEAVRRAMRREAGAAGANAVAPTIPSMNDLPVLGMLDRLFGAEVEADDRLRHTEARAGRAVAVRCPAGSAPRPP